MPTGCDTLVQTILDIFLPESCLLCGTRAGEGAGLIPPGRRVTGLRAWDRPHICTSCWLELRGISPHRWLQTESGLDMAVVGGMATCPAVVSLVGALKYYGVRGLAWPLARLAGRGWGQAVTSGGEVDYLIPVPLHPSRQRSRGFNQAELLARLLARRFAVTLLPDVLLRRRHTPQLAKVTSDFTVRYAKVRGAFQALSPPRAGRCRVGLVDDLITSGATMLAATAELVKAGWQVAWALAPALASTEQPETALDSSLGHS